MRARADNTAFKHHQQWLADHDAKPTKDPNRFVIGGWRVIVAPVSEEVVRQLGTIFGKSATYPEMTS